MLGYCGSARFAEHRTSPSHPERPDRIRAIETAVRQAGLIASPNPFPDFVYDSQIKPVGGSALRELPFAAAEEKWLLSAHSAKHIEWVKSVCRAGGGVLDNGDTPVGASSFEIALLAVGATLRCCDAVMDGTVRRAFAAVRPPGHHAEHDRAMGFCLFNNIAIAARYLQKQHRVHTVAIVDFDVHHGNGTQSCFEDDPSVLYISMHQHPATCYPNSGYDWEVGSDAGRGTTLNIPFNPGADDAAYLHALNARVVPKLHDFKPEVLLLSAGFDAHLDDPLADIHLSEDGFAQMTRLLVEAANAHCGGKVISLLEGGYNLRALGRCVVQHLVNLRDW